MNEKIVFEGSACKKNEKYDYSLSFQEREGGGYEGHLDLNDINLSKNYSVDLTTLFLQPEIDKEVVARALILIKHGLLKPNN